MKRTRRITAIAMALALVITCFNVAPASALGSNKIAKVGSSTKTVSVGQEFELEVKKGKKMKDNNIKWTISKTSIVKYDDKDRTDDEMEFRAVKKGTTKITAKNLKTGGKIVYTVKVKAKSNKISKVGSLSKTMYVGDEMDLEVKKGAGLKDKQIKWSISKSSILGFEDGDKYGDDVEIYAKKAGKTKVTAKNLKTGGKIVYTITVKEKPADYNIAIVGSQSRNVELYDDLELEVKKGYSLAASQIQWTISNPAILAFDEGISTGTEVEVKGLALGTATVTATNLHTGAAISYTVTVIPEVPDYDD